MSCVGQGEDALAEQLRQAHLREVPAKAYPPKWFIQKRKHQRGCMARRAPGIRGASLAV
jgi:hypothetical protein